MTDYLDGTLNMGLLSYVEVLTVMSSTKSVTFHFRGKGSCDLKNWYTGTSRVSREGLFNYNGTNNVCSSQFELSISDNTFVPRDDVISFKMDGNCSDIEHICAENKTAYFIKLQRGIYN